MRLMYSILKWFSNKDLLYIRRIITDILSTNLPYREKSRLFWENNGYYMRDLHISPPNPSEGDLKTFKKYLTIKGNNGRVLLLGPTPLLRHLLSELGFKNYVIADFSFASLQSSSWALNKLGMELDPENEIWIKSEWLEMPLEPESFDFIVGDFVFNQIKSNKQSFFVKKLASLLKKDGVLIARMCICNTNFDHNDPEQIIDEILSSENFENTIEQRRTLLFRLRDRLRDKKAQAASPHTMIDKLLKYQTSDIKKLNFLRSVSKMISKRAEIELPFITQTKDELEKIISKEFSLEKSITAPDYPSEYFPIYVLRKKT